MGKGIINFDAATTNELLNYVKEIKDGGGINLDAPKDGNLYGQQDGEWKQAQEKLVDGESIKTLNGVSVLGSGNIDVAPTIGNNGNWYINGKDTGKPAKGKDGADGVSLGEIALVQETGTESGSENKVMSQKAVSTKFSELEQETGLRLEYKLNKSELPVKDVEEPGIYFVDEKGNVFMVYSNEKGLDVSKISSEMAAKVLAFLNIEDLKSNDIVEVEEDGAFLCNDKGEVFARFVNGKFEAVGLSDGGASNVEILEDIRNVVGGSAGQFLQKQPNGNWAGANIAFPQQSISGLIDVDVNPVEGSILQFKGGKWVNAEISTEGLITTDSRVSNPLYGKHFVCLGDSHKAMSSFLPYLASITGGIYHTTSEKNVDGVPHVFIDEIDRGVSKKAFPYDFAADIQSLIDAEIPIDYLIIENCHLGDKTKWDNAITSFPFVGYQKIVYPTKFNSLADLNSHLTNELWPSIILELGINDIKKSIEFQYLASASQTLVFSFTEGETLNTDVTVTIKFGEDGNPINTTLTTGMSLDECVSKINDWAFQEYSDWTNANKGTTGITEIDLSYSGGG